MTTARAIQDLGQTFYVPEFIVRVDGDRLADPVVHDVLELKVSDSLKDVDSFELTLNNWDEARFKPKYEPPSIGDYEGLFDPGVELEISMGYAGEQRTMLSGIVTALEPAFPASGALTLAVRGLNALHRFRTEQHSTSWEQVTDSEIAKELGSLPLRKGKPGLGIEVKTAPGDEPVEAYVLMDNQYDIVFLQERARRRGYELSLQKREDGSEYLYFGPSESRSEPPVPYLLEWGKSLLSFRPTLSTAAQISEVVVRGWDRRKNRKIEGKASWKDCVPKGPEQARMETLAKAFGNRREIVTDQPVHSKKEAETLAKSILTDQLKSMVTASGQVVGLPDLRSGRRVQIVGLGSRFDGEYYVTEATHTINESGYLTDFKARRENAPQGVGAAAG